MTELAHQHVWDLFLAGHLARVGRGGLPDPADEDGVEFYALWHREFVRLDLPLGDATAASERMARQGRPYPGDHLATLSRLASTCKSERQADERHRDRLRDGASRDTAKAAWDAMTDDDREALKADVLREHPECDRVFRRWPGMLVGACYERLRERIDSESIPTPSRN